jgi:flagellin-specific chaperone FliS
MREYNLGYELSSDEIKQAALTKSPDLQFLQAIDIPEGAKLDIVAVKSLLLDENNEYIGDKTIDANKPIYLPMVIAGHDVLLALVPTLEGMQPFFMDSLGQNAALESRKEIAKSVVMLLKSLKSDVLDLKDISVSQQTHNACGLAVVSNILSLQEAFDKGQAINSIILYQGENKKEYFQKMGDDFVRDGVLPDKKREKRKDTKEELDTKKRQVLKNDLDKAIRDNDTDAAKKCIDQLATNFDPDSFYIPFQGETTKLADYPVFNALINGRVEVFNYMREKIPNLDLSRAISAMNVEINVAQLPCRKEDEMNAGKMKSDKTYSIDEDQLKKVHKILKVLDETLDWEGKKKINLFTLATYFLDVELARKFVNYPKFAEVANEISTRSGRPINYAAGGLDQDPRYKELFDLLYGSAEVKNSLHQNKNFVSNLLDSGQFNIAHQFLKDNIGKIDSTILPILLNGVLSSGIREVKEGKKTEVNSLVDAYSIILKEVLKKAVNEGLSGGDISDQLSLVPANIFVINEKDQFIGKQYLEATINQLKPLLEKGAVKLKDLCNIDPDFLMLLADNVNLLKNVKLSIDDSAMLVGAISEEALNVLKKQDPLLHQFIEIGRDTMKLYDFVNKLDRDKEFRAKYDAMKKTSNLFPLNIIDSKLQKVEQSRGFFGNLIKRLNDRFFPLQVDVTTTPILAEIDKVNEIQTVAGTYKKAHRKIIETSKQEDVNPKLESLKKLKDEYDKTVMKIKSTEGAIDSTEALQKLNLKFLEILASPESISKTNKAELVREARVEYLSSAFTKEIAERIEKLYTINCAEILQKTLQNTFKIIDTNKRLDPKAKIKQIEVLLKNVDMVLAHPSKDVKVNIAAITHTIPVDDKLAIKFKKKSSNGAERGA